VAVHNGFLVNVRMLIKKQNKAINIIKIFHQNRNNILNEAKIYFASFQGFSHSLINRHTTMPLPFFCRLLD